MKNKEKTNNNNKICNGKLPISSKQLTDSKYFKQKTVAIRGKTIKLIIGDTIKASNLLRNLFFR